MNAIVLSAVFGVVMMFSGISTAQRQAIRTIAIICLALLLVGNIAEQLGYNFFRFNTRNMLVFDNFGLLFNSIAFGSTLLYFFLSGRDMEKVGVNLAEYFALIFFVLCGVAISSSFNTLLMLFLGIEIISIPLYILTGSDKRNLKSNEASLKYFLMGSFSTGIMLMGIALVYGGNSLGSFYISTINLGKGGLPPMIAAGLVLLVVAMS